MMNPLQTRFFALRGGLDLVTPAVETPPGRVIAGVNYEPHRRGYRRVDGFERFDGQPKPSEASYSVLNFDAGVTAVAEGDTVTGATSGATGKALIAGVLETGTYAGSDATGYLVLTNVSGTFQDNENLEVSAATVCVANGTAVDRGALTDANDSTWHRDAIETARALIAKPSGSGPVRGAWMYKGVVYAFRDNAGATAAVMHKSTTSGWTAVDLGSEISFDAGTVEFTEDDTLTGGTSAATATIKRVVLESGDWSTSDATGRLILSGVTGTFQDNETITDGAGGSATSASADSAITLSAGGHYQFRNHNFYGASNLLRMYGVNGVDRGFEFDGTVFVPIATGMTTDTPNRVEVHRNHLFFAFPGGSAQHSSTGNPYQWTVITGAGEIGIGEEITDMLSSASGSLTILGRNKTCVLFGDDSANWVLSTIADDAGGIAWTTQNIGAPYYLDDIGIRSLETTQKFGDFRIGTITEMVEPVFEQQRVAGVTPVGSIRVRGKDQYRLFWSDGTGLTIYFGRQPAESLPFDLGITVFCAASCEDTDGNEVLLVGDDQGMVYQLDAGTSFDGSEVQAYLRFAFNHVGSPSKHKRWKKAVLEMDGGPDTQIGLVAEFSYSNSDQPPSTEQTFSVSGSGGIWNEFNWNDFYWSSPVEGQAEAHIDGLGINLSIAAISDATYEEPHILHGMTLQFTYRGDAR